MKKILLYAFSVCTILYMILFPEKAIGETKNAIALCAEAIVPALFVFLICSQLLINTGFAKIIKKPFEKIMYPLFKINGAGALAVILGCLSGYPVGALCTCELYRNGDLSKNEAERLLGFCNNAGPLFIIGSVGTVMLKNKKIGYLLWVVNILSSVMCGMLLSLFKKDEKSENAKRGLSMSVRFSEAVSKSVKNAIVSVANICAYTILFSVVQSMMFLIFGINPISIVVSSAIEITSAINKMCMFESGFVSCGGILPYIAFALGFGGLCVHMQVVCAVRKTNLGLGGYFIGKSVQAFIFSAVVFLLTKRIL